MEHTKSPWFVSIQGIDNVTNERIIRIATTENNKWGDAEKDKNIIAAAPDMYEILKNHLDELETLEPLQTERKQWMNRHINELRSIIAKAEGR